jgi:hypothetical protein
VSWPFTLVAVCSTLPSTPLRAASSLVCLARVPVEDTKSLRLSGRSGRGNGADRGSDGKVLELHIGKMGRRWRSKYKRDGISACLYNYQPIFPTQPILYSQPDPSRLFPEPSIRLHQTTAFDIAQTDISVTILWGKHSLDG